MLLISGAFCVYFSEYNYAETYSNSKLYHLLYLEGCQIINGNWNLVMNASFLAVKNLKIP